MVYLYLMGSDLFLHHRCRAPDDVGRNKNLSLLCPVQDQGQHLIELLKVPLCLVHKQMIGKGTVRVNLKQMLLRIQIKPVMYIHIHLHSIKYYNV